MPRLFFVDDQGGSRELHAGRSVVIYREDCMNVSDWRRNFTARTVNSLSLESSLGRSLRISVLLLQETDGLVT